MDNGRLIVGLRQVGQGIERWIHVTNRIFSAIGEVVLFLMMLLVTFDVAGRYLAKSPLRGSTDFVILMMIIVVFSELAYCAAQDGHIRVEVIYARLPRCIRANLDSITSFAGAFIFAIITWQMGKQAYNIIIGKAIMVTSIWEFPFLPFICVAVVGSLLLCLELFIQFSHSLTHRK